MAPTTTTTATTTATTRSPSIGFTLQNGKHFANTLLPRLYSDIVLHLFVRLPTRTAIFNPCTRMLLYAYTPPLCALVCTFLIYCNALTPPPLGRLLTPFCTLHSHVSGTLCFRAFALPSFPDLRPYATASDPCYLLPVFCSCFLLPVT